MDAELRDALSEIIRLLREPKIAPCPPATMTVQGSCEHCYCIPPTSTSFHSKCCKCGNERNPTQWA